MSTSKCPCGTGEETICEWINAPKVSALWCKVTGSECKVNAHVSKQSALDLPARLHIDCSTPTHCSTFTYTLQHAYTLIAAPLHTAPLLHTAAPYTLQHL